jgi:hypothetical protein
VGGPTALRRLLRSRLAFAPLGGLLVSTGETENLDYSTQPAPRRYAILLRSRTSPDVRVGAYATMLPTLVPSFGRFEATLSRLEDSSALTHDHLVPQCPP